MGVISPSVDAYTRMLRHLLPPGRLWETTAGQWLYNVLKASADELVRVSGRVVDLLLEGDPSQATETLEDYERVLGLDSLGTTAARQAAVLAALTKRLKFRPADFAAGLAPILDLDVADVDVRETSRAQAVAVGDDREIFRFFVYRDPGLPGTYDLNKAQAWIDSAAPAHTKGHVIESIDFLCDDPYSLCDRDLLGV